MKRLVEAPAHQRTGRMRAVGIVATTAVLVLISPVVAAGAAHVRIEPPSAGMTVATGVAAGSKYASSTSAPAPGPVDLLLDVHLNGQAQDTVLLLGLGAQPNRNLCADELEFKRWRLRLPPVNPYRYEGEDYYPLHAVPGLRYRVDTSTETLSITVPAADFEGTVVDGLITRNPTPQPTPLGGFLNYDFLGTRNAGLNSLDGLVQAGVFNDWGVGTTSFVGQNFNHAHSQWVRLDTTWTHDDAATMTSLRLGDSVTDGGMSGLPVRMGGIEYGTDFTTRPYFVTFPMPGLGGQAVLPSTVQLYINGMLKESQQVPPGPFSVPAVPVVAGPGTAKLVVRDMLGREQVITTSFYTSSELLKPGLNDYSFSVGKLRENYGIESNGYGPFAASGVFRHGFSDWLTGEVHAESSGDLKDASAGVSFATPAAGVFDFALGVSHSNLGRGALGLIGFQYQGRIFNGGFSVQLASPRFTELGFNGLPAPSKQITASAGAFLGDAGSLSLGYADQDSPLFGRVRLVTAGYSKSFGSGFFSANAFHTVGGASDNGIDLSFTMHFGERTSISTGVTRQNGIDQAFTQVQESLPVGTGSGYRVNVEAGPDAIDQAEYDYQNGVGTYRVGAWQSAGQTSYQAEASGALAFLGGDVFPARQVQGAFGLVQVPGLANVTVYADNQPVGATDSKGDALIPVLRPYQDNAIRLGANSIPLSAQVNTLQLDAVPRYRSGVIVKFPATSLRGATFVIKLEDGMPLPAGATVQIVGQKERFPVALAGETYVTGLAAHNVLRANWNGQSCEFDVDLPKTSDPLPDLGAFTCRGIKR